MSISIITINRNNASGLRATIESVLHQTSQDFEYIIVDGASSDDSVGIIKSAAEKRKIIWKSEPDSGIYNAMNKGAGLASGGFLLFLNSGDTLANANVIDSLSSININSDIVVGRINFTDANGIFHKDYQQAGNCKSLYGFLGTMIPHQATLIKRDTFLAIGPYEEKYRIVADWQYCLKAVLAGCSVQFIPITIANFDNTGISSTENSKMMKEIAAAQTATLPVCINNDYHWVAEHKGDLERINWLSKHKGFYKIFKALVAFGKRISR